MLQSIRKWFGIENNNELDNEVEADEAYVGGKNNNRHNNKKSIATQRRRAKVKTPVVGTVERNGKLNANVVDNVCPANLTREIVANLKESAFQYTD